MRYRFDWILFMVTQVLSFSRSGLTDFVTQRVSACIMAGYTLLLTWFFSTTDVTHSILLEFFLSTPVQIFSTMTILSILAHAWVGLWTVGTDYIRSAHLGFIPGLANFSTAIRFLYQVVCLLVMFIYLIWAMKLIWQF